MEEILVKLADILDMSVEGLMQYYPVLRDQLVAYNVLSSLSLFLSISLFCVPLLVMFGAIILDTSNIINMRDVATKKNITTLVICLILLVVLLITTSVSKSVLAKDLIMIKSFL